jgi:phosphoribosylanthranilate isomerase
MSLKARVFATHVSSLSDARYFAGMGATYIAIQVNPELPGYLAPEKFKEIAGWIAGPEFILQINGLNPEQIELAKKNYGIDSLLVSGKLIESNSGDERNYFPEINASEFLQVKDRIHKLHPEIILVHVDLPETDMKSILNELSLVAENIFLGNISSTQTAEVYLNEFPNLSFAVSGTPETQVGLKEYDFREFLEYLDSDL